MANTKWQRWTMNAPVSPQRYVLRSLLFGPLAFEKWPQKLTKKTSLHHGGTVGRKVWGLLGVVGCPAVQFVQNVAAAWTKPDGTTIEAIPHMHNWWAWMTRSPIRAIMWTGFTHKQPISAAKGKQLEKSLSSPVALAPVERDWFCNRFLSV